MYLYGYTFLVKNMIMSYSSVLLKFWIRSQIDFEKMIMSYFFSLICEKVICF
jgi:hypothetical protein